MSRTLKCVGWLGMVGLSMVDALWAAALGKPVLVVVAVVLACVGTIVFVAELLTKPAPPETLDVDA